MSRKIVLVLAIAGAWGALFAGEGHAKKKAAAGAGTTVAVKAGGLELQLPKSWQGSQPSSSMRLAQFAVPQAGGDKEPAEFVVFYFGAGGGGGIKPNIDRWVAQVAPEGRTVTLTQGKSKQGDYVAATISGTFNMPVGPPMGGQSRPVKNAQVLGIIVLNDTGPYFLKMWGQEKTMAVAGRDLRKALGAEGIEKPFTD